MKVLSKVMSTALVAMALSTPALAKAGVEENALKALMNQNAVVPNSGGQLVRVNAAIAMIMTSSFNDKGEGALSVITNKCKAQARGVYKCRLNIHSSDRKIDANGAYAPAEGMTESSLTIDYKVNETGKIMIGKPSIFFAG
ncbi:MAG: hypothetical protein KF681_02815 [Bdellovibrionaceae bacterium]|nr:hypothetical protein [Pseudobdellovibrionaceae bacterium]